MRVAVVGSGIGGLTAAYELINGGAEVVLYEKEHVVGGRAGSVTVDGVELELGVLVTDETMMETLEKLDVEVETSGMSFSISLNNGAAYEWGNNKGFSSLFAKKSNILNLYFWHMLGDVVKFKNDAIKYLEEHEEDPYMDNSETLEFFIKSHGYSHLLQQAYIIPICASIWSYPFEPKNFSAYSVLSFFRNRNLLQLFGRPQWFSLRCSSQNYINKIKAELESRGCHIRLGCEVKSVSSTDNGCSVLTTNTSEEVFDECIISIHAPHALKILENQITYEESRILGSFQYVYSDTYLHCDGNLMPQNPSAWSSWNFLGTIDNGVFITYWLNVLQKLGLSSKPFFVTLNPSHVPKNALLKWISCHPIPSVASCKASLELHKIQGKRGLWFCGTYQGHCFHEDGLKAGFVTARNLLGKDLKIMKNPRHMVPSLLEAGARLIVTKFLRSFILTGYLTLFEDGGTMFAFEGNNKKVNAKSILKVHDPLFYWKIATEGDLGLAAAYINGYFSFNDEKDGLLDLLLVLIANRDLMNSSNNIQHKRGWWTPLLLTVGVSSARYFLQHILRSNTLSQACRNISLHYDLSNKFFSLFLDETMTYSCAIFKTGNEDLKVAQLHKLSVLIEKGKINANHNILEIGCGWGSLAIEVVKHTGCKYTGITLSIEQLQFAKRRVAEAGLEGQITFLLCDYRQLPTFQKYDRIISCEMLEHVGHEYFGELFSCFEEHLAEDGLCLLQFSSVPDPRYEEYRRSSDFIKEYIFPGACVPSLSSITTAMAASSKLCVEHAENIGIHYYRTLMHWRSNFLSNKSEVLALGFDEKFIRMWDYYFVYCAAGFKSRTLGVYQVVLSRPGNVRALNVQSDEGIPFI